MFSETFVEEIDFLAENLTAHQKYLKSIGMTESDLETPNIVTGSTVGSVIITLMIVTIVGLDLLNIKHHFKMLIDNLKDGLSRLKS